MNGWNVKSAILDFVYPASCPFCGKEAARPDYCCKECADKLAPPAELIDLPPLNGFLSVTAYNDYSKKIIHAAKEENDGCAITAMAVLMYKRILSQGLADKIDGITYVPMHRADKRRRGYNQSRLLAQELERLTGKPCVNLLEKTRRTAEQKSLNAQQRRENLAGAFKFARKHKAEGASVLLIDDVCTTGSTLRECGAQLVAAGMKNVFALVFAKTENFS